MSKILHQELAKRFFGQIGAAPEGIGKALTSSEYFVKEITTSAEGRPIKCSVFGAQSPASKLMLVDLSGGRGYEFAMVYDIGNVLGLKFVWDGDDHGLFLSRTGATWMQAALWQVLAFAAAHEGAINQGVPWLPFTELDENLYGQLISLIECDLLSDES